VVAVAVSGPDNVGKSTQIRLLARVDGVAEAGPLDAHDPRWAGAHALGLAEWWFQRAALEEVVDVLACSYLARSAAADSAGLVRLVDRGIPMLEASIVATAAVRERLGYQAAVQRARELLAGYRDDLEKAEAREWGVLLLHAAGPAAGTMRALAREQQVTPAYATYQRVLNDHLHALAGAGRFAQAIVVAGRPILDVQQELRGLLRGRLGLPVPGMAVHRAGVTAELAKLLGDHLTVLYLDASPGLREARGLAGPADVRERDAVKRSRGAERIRELADTVIDNNGPRLALYRALDKIASERWPPATPQRAAVADLELPSRLAAYVDALLARVADPAAPLVSLLAVTGSGARGKYQQGWSDLDVLAVAEQDTLSRLRAVLAELAGRLGGVKLGFTIVSEAECATAAVSPRLLHTLALIGAGRLPVLWCADTLTLPCPDQETDALASLSDGVAAAIEIRRQLLRTQLDLRSLYKVTALAAKVGLRADGEEHPGDTEALHELVRRFPASFTGLDPGVVAAARRDEQAATQLAHAVLAWWLAMLPATGPPR
jgi:hypothetical protein